MTASAADIRDTLTFLIPGFVCMKLFYQFGLRTKRSDAQWALWSILAAAPIRWLAEMTTGEEQTRTLLTFLWAIAAGLLLALGWQLLVRAVPAVAIDHAVRAWDIVFMQPTARWVQVITKEHGTFLGQVTSAATSIESDDLDLLLTKPAIVEGSGSRDLTGVESVLIRREDVAALYIFAPMSTRE
jgi:hypothetical protein